jgi:hypothetical protein
MEMGRFPDQKCAIFYMIEASGNSPRRGGTSIPRSELKKSRGWTKAYKEGIRHRAYGSGKKLLF